MGANCLCVIVKVLLLVAQLSGIVRATASAEVDSPTPTQLVDGPTASATLPLSIYNSLNSNNVHAYISAYDKTGNLFFIQNDLTAYFPPNPPANQSAKITAPIAFPLGACGSTKTIDIKYYLQNSSRLWLADGELTFYVNSGAIRAALRSPSVSNPSDDNFNVNWGFGELVYQEDGTVFADISYIDFVGLPVGVSLDTKSGLQTAPGLPATGVRDVCSDLKPLNTTDQPWANLCRNDSHGNLLRVVSPLQLITGFENGQQDYSFKDYWDGYVTDVYNHFESTDLTINSYTDVGDVTGQVTNNILVFNTPNNGSYPYAKPDAVDIFGCSSGPFSNTGNDLNKNIGKILCAAFNRATFFVPNGTVQPDGVTDYTYFYKTPPFNWYSKIIHERELDHRGYAFSYDDVHPKDGPDVAGVVADTFSNVKSFTFYAGGPSSTSVCDSDELKRRDAAAL